MKQRPDRMVMLFPNEAEPDHRLRAGEPRIVPGAPTVAGVAAERIVASPSRGPEFLLVVASTTDWETAPGELAGIYRSFPTRGVLQKLDGQLRSLELQSVSGDSRRPVVCEVLIPYHVRPSGKAAREGPSSDR